MPDKERLKCRWCDYTVPKFYTTKRGVQKSGWGRLQAHGDYHHPAEIAKFEAQLREHNNAKN